MGIDIRTIEESELRDTFVALETAFGAHLEDDFLAFHRPFVEVDRTLGAFDGSTLIGTSSVSSFSMTIPGGEVAAAGVTAVGVIPSHRRQGVNTSLMRAQLDDARARGEAVAVLYASEGSIYGRFGYGIASFHAAIDVETRRSAFGPWFEPSGVVRLYERDEAVRRFHPVYEALRRTRPGMMRLSEREFGYRLDDRFRHDAKAEQGFYAAHETAGQVDAYTQYRVKFEWDVVPKSEVKVEDLIATTPQAYADMWRYIFDIDLMFRVTAWNRPSDDPLLDLLLEPRALQFRLGDALWVRLVDVESALASRSYRCDATVVLEVRDGFCPWIQGRYELSTSSGGARCRRTDAEPDAVLGASELGAAYLGGTRIASLARAGRIHERTPGAIERIDAAFAWDPAPWCSFLF